MSNKMRVRFAPSPTGYLHIGGMRTALYNYLLAKKQGGQFLLRIEDTDRSRYVEGAEEYILDSLKWAGIEPDESIIHEGEHGPYRQSERKELYQRHAQMLIESGHAYYAFDTSEELEKLRADLKEEGGSIQQYNAATRERMKNSYTLSAEEVQSRIENGDKYVIRMNIPADEQITFYDNIREEVSFDSNLLDDKILFKSDGMPTYHLANVIDDHLMEISHVIRGEEWLSSTALHVALYKAFSWEDTIPEFSHLPLILKPEGKGKLSKRDGDKHGFPVFPLEWENTEMGKMQPGYREIGFLPVAFNNMLAFIGWNPGTEQEIFTMDELIEAFSVDRVQKGGGRFDFEKAKWFNQQFILSMNEAELASYIHPYLADEQSISEEQIESVLPYVKERMHLLTDFWGQSSFYFKAPTEYDEKMSRKKYKADKKDKYEALCSMLAALENFDSEHIESSVKAFLEEHELGFGAVLPIFRLVLTGSMKGASVFDIASYIGQEETISRFNKGLSHLESINA